MKSFYKSLLAVTFAIMASFATIVPANAGLIHFDGSNTTFGDVVNFDFTFNDTTHVINSITGSVTTATTGTASITSLLSISESNDHGGSSGFNFDQLFDTMLFTGFDTGGIAFNIMGGFKSNIYQDNGGLLFSINPGAGEVYNPGHRLTKWSSRVIEGTVPEPSTILLIALAAVAFYFTRRRNTTVTRKSLTTRNNTSRWNFA